MTTISDLPEDSGEEILSRIPLTSLSAVRQTCKNCNSYTKNHILGKAARAGKQFLGFMLMDFQICSLRFNIHKDDDSVDLSIKQVSLFNQDQIYNVFHCDGLLLCVIKDDWSEIPRLVVWNPYMGQTKCIQPRKQYHMFDIFALGSDNNSNYKIIRFLDDFDGTQTLFWFEIYDFRSDSWRALDVNPDWVITHYQQAVTLKGNAYFVAQEKRNIYEAISEVEVFVLCFDFTTESFGPRLPLPFHSFDMFRETVTLSSVRDEQLAVLFQQRGNKTMEFWITTKIDPNVVSWSKFLKVERTQLPPRFFAGSFFIDEEKRAAVVSCLLKYKPTNTCPSYHTTYIFGQDGCFKSVDFGEARKLHMFAYYNQLMFSSYVPSLVQLQRGKRKEMDH